VVKLSADLTTQTDLGFTGFNGAFGVAVDTAGNVYDTDAAVGANPEVLKLAAG
jgi:hypothetical protein